MATDPIICTTADGVATITLNRPDVLNSFNSAMARDLQATLDLLRALVGTQSAQPNQLLNLAREFRRVMQKA